MSNLDARRCEVMMALQQALLGEVSPQIRAVSVSWEDGSIHFLAYIDGPISEEVRESMSCSETELMALFPSSESVTHEVIRLDEPLPIPKDLVWVYRRREE